MAGTSPGLPGIDILEQMIILFSSYWKEHWSMPVDN